MRPTLIPSLFLVLITALAFWPARNATFLRYDDTFHVTNNPYILPPTPARLAYFWRYPFDRRPVAGIVSDAGQLKAPYHQIYTPLAFTVWGLLVYPARIAPLPNSSGPQEQSSPQTDFSLDPSIYHSFNLGLHVLNVLLVFALIRSFVKQEWSAALGALLFAIHPVQVEPVAWVTGMNNLLSGFFALLALLLYLNKREESEKPRWSEGSYWGATFCFLLSVLSKPSSVTLPVLALLLCWGLGEKKWRLRLWEMSLWLAVVLFCIVANGLVSDGNTGFKPVSWQKPFLIGDSLTFYAGKFFFPWHLAPDYGRRPEWVMQQSLTYVVWLIPMATGLLTMQWWRRSVNSGKEDSIARIALMSLGFFVVVLLPSSGLVNYYFHYISIVADRYMYLAVIGPAILVSAVAARYFESRSNSRRRVLAVLSVGLAATLTFLSFKQTSFWQNDELLWAHNVAVVPQSTVAYYQYGVALSAREDYQEAIPVFQQALEVSQDKEIVEAALAHDYLQTKDYAKAELGYRKALQIQPAFLDVHLAYGTMLASRGRVNDAIDQFDLGLQIQPENPLLLGCMGITLVDAGKNAEGAAFLRNALQHGFDLARGHFYLGNALSKEGDIEGAIREWVSTVNIAPEYYMAYFNLGTAVAKQGKTAQAIQLFKRTLQLRPNYAPAQAQLGLQWQKQGQMEKARAAFRAALENDPQNVLALNALKK